MSFNVGALFVSCTVCACTTPVFNTFSEKHYFLGHGSNCVSPAYPPCKGRRAGIAHNFCFQWLN